MPSETDLLNDALCQIGASRITGIDEGSINANHCLTFYPKLRDDLLRTAHWRFAAAREELVQDVEKPLFEFAFQYSLPLDFLKIREYNGASLDTTNLALFERATVRRYEIEGRKLVTNDAEAKIVFTKRITDPNIFDSLFYQTLTTWLASKLANGITKDTKRALDLLRKALEVLLPMALNVDGQEGSVEPYIADELQRGR